MKSADGTNVSASALTPALGELVTRAAEMGLPAWQFDGDGRLRVEPPGPDVAAPLVRSDHLRQLLASAAATALDGSEAEPQRLFEGCWAIPVVESLGSRKLAAAMTVVMTTDGAADTAFARLAADCGCDAAALARDIAPLLRPGGLDVSQLASVLRWMHQDILKVHRDQHTLAEFSERLSQAYEETNLLFRLARSLSCVRDPAELIQTLCNQLQQIMPFGWLAIRFHPHSGEVRDLAGRLMVAGQLPFELARLDEESLKLLSRFGGDDWTRLLEPHGSPLAALARSEVLAEPITHDDKVIGTLLAGNKTGADPQLSSMEMQFLDAVADFLGIFHENVARYAEQQAMFVGTLQALTSSIDAKDRYTCGHSERVALLAAQLAEAIGLDKQEVERYRITGLVHDVGKIGIPESVLAKPGRLSDEEFSLIKRHPEIGHRILRDIPAMADMLPGVLHHHERWDGRGYPRGLSGEQIPLMARVLALADSFDAMSSTRAYRPSIPRQRVLEEIVRCAGTQFDPNLADVFVGLDFTQFDALLAQQSASLIAPTSVTSRAA